VRLSCPLLKAKLRKDGVFFRILVDHRVEAQVGH
jgi:hypothetical protein